MAITTVIKNALNQLLAPANLRLDTLTATIDEQRRIQGLEAGGLLQGQRYNRLPAMDEEFLSGMIRLYPSVTAELARLVQGGNDVDYSHDNGFFLTPDLQALYLVLRLQNPACLVEVGCGNSTRIARQAIIDGGLATRIISIDPAPRTDIAAFADEVILERLEDIPDETISGRLAPGDVLFIDSSHQVRVGNDVVRAICRLLPGLPPGIIVHFHDIFLPFEYPQPFAGFYPEWGEQYLLYAYLLHSDVSLLWPGYLLQQTRPELRETLPFLATGTAQSFWFRLGEQPGDGVN